MIIDSHCHAWRVWPYDTGVPDPATRGSAEALLYEMDTHDVDHATIVCARIGAGRGGAGGSNDDNNEYVTNFAARHPDRISVLVDVDCVWRPEHHTTGAAQRLETELDRTGAVGFTHYVSGDNDGWFGTAEAGWFFAAAASRGALASIAAGPAWYDDLGHVATAHPTLSILLHHMGHPGRDDAGHRPADVDRLRALADQPNVYVKVSGFNYNSAESHRYPYSDSQQLFGGLVESFGPERLLWGSDFPASRDMLTYTQSLEVLTEDVDLATEDLDRIRGGNLQRLLSL